MSRQGFRTKSNQKTLLWVCALVLVNSLSIFLSKANAQFQQFATGLAPSQVAVLVNTLDPQSVAVAEHFRTSHGIPTSNIISIQIPAAEISSDGIISQTAFNSLKATADSLTPQGIQAYAISWTTPYRVLKSGSAACNGITNRDCMSITSAIAFGFDSKYVNTNQITCSDPALARNPYYNTDSKAPFSDFQIRPAMMIAGVNTAQATALINRGAAARGTNPTGTGYLIRSSDTVRAGIRSFGFSSIATQFSTSQNNFGTLYQDNSSGGSQDYFEGQNDVLFYFVDVATVSFISNGSSTNVFLPGAVADHATSFGGQIHTAAGTGQMNVLRWLEEGATGSYGTVVEPTNTTMKFPNVRILMENYFSGSSLIEAYWKSVPCPGEGLFVGDPLASPWGAPVVTNLNGTLTVTTSAMKPGTTYTIYSRHNFNGEVIHLQTGITTATFRRNTLTIPNTSQFRSYYLVVSSDAPPEAPGDTQPPGAPTNLRTF